MPPLRVIAIDWSGAADTRTQRKAIWIADFQSGLISLEGGRTRNEVCDWLIEQAFSTPRMVVGFDFAFSLPAWFLRSQNIASAASLWSRAGGGESEEWLRSCQPPFWGRLGRRRPEGHREPGWLGFRDTDRTLDIAGIRPKSPFQIGGAGAVGTGSLRGMPILHRLHNEGFCIWPFTPIPKENSCPIVTEIYPRLFTGPVKKSNAASRRKYLESEDYAAIPPGIVDRARASEDAFDALLSALAMAKYESRFPNLEQSTDPTTLLEGAIWKPRSA